MKFRSRVDLWLPLVVFGPIGLALWFIISDYRIEANGTLLVAGAVCVGALALMLWIFVGTSYTVTETDLIIRSGPVRATLPLASIRRVRQSHTVLAGPALSLRRLEIDHGKYDTAIVSPLDVAGFIEALRSGNPSIEFV